MLLLMPKLYRKENGPFFNHNGNYQVELSVIPLGTEIRNYGIAGVV